MSQLSPFVRAFRILGGRLHMEAEKRYPREGRVEPPRNPEYENETVALVLGSLAQVFDATATDLEQQIAADLSRTGRQPPEDIRGWPDDGTVEGDWTDRVG
jgi:hypothetical protein